MNIKIDGDEINRVKDFMLLGAISVEIHIPHNLKNFQKCWGYA